MKYHGFTPLTGYRYMSKERAIRPPNEEEKLNDPILKNKSEINIKWKDLEVEDPSVINSIISKIITKIKNG